jgi:ribosomal protein L32
MCRLIEDVNDKELKKCQDCGREYRSRLPAHKIHLNCSVKIDPPLIFKNRIPFPDKLKNLAQDTFKFINHGMPISSQELIDKRLDICNNCPFFDKEKKVCNKCGCHMEYKVIAATSTCPEGKW